MKKDPMACTDLFWRLIMRLTNFLGERGIERQNQDNKRLISGLTVRQQQVVRKVYILTLRRPEGVPLKMLAEQLELSPGTVSEAVETLVKVLESLMRNQLPFRVLPTDRDGVRDLAGCTAVIVPGAKLLSDRAVEELRAFPGRLFVVGRRPATTTRSSASARRTRSRTPRVCRWRPMKCCRRTSGRASASCGTTGRRTFRNSRRPNLRRRVSRTGNATRRGRSAACS